MYYLKILLSNFLIVFFADYLLPGIEVTKQTKIPHIEGDLLFALVLGFFNSMIFPLLKVMEKGASLSRIALTALILNFAVYGIVTLLPLGIHFANIEGYLIVSAVVTVGGFLTNFFEMKHAKQGEPQV